MRLGLDKVSSKSTIHRASARIPESYYRRIHFCVITSIVAGNLAGDSSGFSIRKFIPWCITKKDIEKIKRGWRKLHIIIDIRTRVILDYRVTHAYRGDTPVMMDILKDMANSLYCIIGDVCFDCTIHCTKDLQYYIEDGRHPLHKAKI